MRIDPNEGITVGQGADSVHSAAPKTSSPAASQVQQGDPQDRAVLSSDAQQFSNLSAALANTPAIRQNRVDQLRQAIQSGTYAPSSRDIAQSLVRDFMPTSAGK